MNQYFTGDDPLRESVRRGIINTEKLGGGVDLIIMLGRLRWPVDDHLIPPATAVRNNIGRTVKT